MEIITKSEGGKLHVSLKGELDHHGGRDAIDRLRFLIREELPMQCLLDFSGVTFMDSSGIAVIIYVYRQLGRYGGKIILENLPRQSQRVITAAGIDKLIPCEMRG